MDKISLHSSAVTKYGSDVPFHSKS